MATKEYGFMGEPFPSKKFQKVIAEYLRPGEAYEVDLKVGEHTYVLIPLEETRLPHRSDHG